MRNRIIFFLILIIQANLIFSEEEICREVIPSQIQIEKSKYLKERILPQRNTVQETVFLLQNSPLENIKIFVRKILISTDLKLPPRQLRNVVSSFEKKALSLKDIETLIRVLRKTLIDEGFKDFQIILPEQILNEEGVLRIKIEAKRR